MGCVDAEMSSLSLDQAIAQAREKASQGGADAAAQAQMAEWLDELRWRRRGLAGRPVVKAGLCLICEGPLADPRETAVCEKCVAEQDALPEHLRRCPTIGEQMAAMTAAGVSADQLALEKHAAEHPDLDAPGCEWCEVESMRFDR